MNHLDYVASREQEFNDNVRHAQFLGATVVRRYLTWLLAEVEKELGARGGPVGGGDNELLIEPVRDVMAEIFNNDRINDLVSHKLSEFGFGQDVIDRVLE